MAKEMKVYRVWARCIAYVYVDIEAENADKARELADDLDSGSFHDDGYGDWEFSDVSEIENVDPDYTQEELEEDEE